MTKKKIICTLVSLAGLGLWSCSDSMTETPVAVPNGDDAAVASAFYGIRLEDSDETRTRDTHKEYDDDFERQEWFNKGTANERAIIDDPECNRVMFFNADYSFYGSGKLRRPDVPGVASNIYVAPMSMASKTFPAYAMVVINSDPTRLDELETTLAAAGTNGAKTLLTYLNKVDTSDPESLAMTQGYFTMSSTIYRLEDSESIFDLTPLRTDGPVFFETVEEAILPENLVKFNVERLLAKFTFIVKDGNRRFNDSKPIILPGSNKLKVRMEYAPTDAQATKDIMTEWQVNLVNWGLNGLEKNEYLVKNLVEKPATYPFSISSNYYIGWNAPILERSYWGIDENYSSGVYPYQYRQALDSDGVLSATTNNIYSAGYDDTKGLTKGNYSLIYKPYSAYTERTENKYTVENSFDSSIHSEQDLSTSPWLRCGTHIILTAQLIFNEVDKDVDLTKADATGFISGVSDKYFSNGLWWSEAALKQQALSTLFTNIYYNKESAPIPDVVNGGNIAFINTLENTLDDNTPLAVKDANGNIVPLKHDDLADNAEEYFEFAPAFIKGGDGWVSLKKIDGVELYAYYQKFNPDGSVTNYVLDPLTDAQLASYIYRFTNLAKHYKQGRMYYALAIRHNLDSENFLTNPVTQVNTGDYGVVRNTWYRMTLNNVLHPGTPVDDQDQPIIPNPEPDEKSLGVEVEIIPWRTVDITVDQLH